MNINNTKNTLNRIYRQLSHSNLENSLVVNSTMLGLETALLNHNFSAMEKFELFNYMSSKKMLRLFQKAYEIFETNLETDFAKLIINRSNLPIEDFIRYPLYKRFVTLLNNEIKLANIKRIDRVLFIGSGPIPVTAVLIHQLSGAPVDCVEKNSDSAELSDKVIKKLGYSNTITVINRDAVDIDCSPYSVILVALLAKPKNLLLKSILNSCNRGTRIICRTSDSIREAFYETTANSLFDRYNSKKKIFAKADQTISSVLIIKL